ncbi:MAG TPA: hypothetical protein DC014_01920 [Treponema sp.]|jgi:ribosomal protein RSM22 (predicted rRNA methylase)|nr:hypothetical protein [Treponema sp.]
MPSERESPVVTSVDSLFTQRSIPSDAKALLAEFDKVIASTHPLNSKQRAQLPQVIRELSHSLTDERDKRHLGYMNRTETLSAYTHYFMWWNLVRLTKLFVNMSDRFFSLNDGDICLDIGSGPLTLVTALFMARKELRQKKLTWYCMDISQQALTVGENIFYTVASRLGCQPWNIIRVKGELGCTIKQKAHLVTSANVFNEVLQKQTMPPDYLAKKQCQNLISYAQKTDARILVIEPGVPSCARFISLIRDAFLRKDFIPVSPCTHCEACPMDGKRGGKWCNYVSSTTDAPKALKHLSDSAHLQKERAVLSFIAVQNKVTEEKTEDITFRIASDSIRLPGNRQGYYACSPLGLLLVVTQTQLASGESYRLTLNTNKPLRTDAKSGAYILNLD